MIFNRRICFAVLVLLAILAIPAPSLADGIPSTPISQKAREQVVKIYDEARGKMRLCSPAFDSAPSQNPELGMRFVLPDGQPKVIEASGNEINNIFMDVRASSMRCVYVVNGFLVPHYRPPSGWQKTPTLTREIAVRRAREYLDVFKMDVPPDYKLLEASFGGHGGTGRWLVRWCRFSGPYPWDCDESLRSETVGVAFYEKEGLVYLFAGGFNCPAPRSLKVKVSKEEAIAKATRYLNHTWYDPLHRVVRKSVVTTVGTCELRVSAPRLYAPAEGDKLLEGQPPRETRLCWKTELSVWKKDRDGSNMDARGFLMLVWVDAETGAVVRVEDNSVA